MLLSYGVWAALDFKNKWKSNRVFVMLGDGEEQEWNVSEAARHWAVLGLNNLIVILDKNLKQLWTSVKNVDISDVKKIWEWYWYNIFEIKDGHNINSIRNELTEILNYIENSNKPTFIVVNTIKGKWLIWAEKHFSGYHSFSACKLNIIKESLDNIENIDSISVKKIISKIKNNIKNLIISKPKIYPIEFDFSIIKSANSLDEGMVNFIKSISTYYDKYRWWEKWDLYVLTADLVKESQIEDLWVLNKKHVHFYNVWIREQHLMAMSHGLYTSNPNNTIILIANDGFLYRFSDQLNALAQWKSKIIIFSTDDGISEARNWSTHQSTWQPWLILNMPFVNFYEPYNTLDLYNILKKVVSKKELAYIRTYDIPVQFHNVYTDSISSYVIYQPKNKVDLIIVSSGYPVGEAVKLAKLKEKDWIWVKVINVVSPKLLDKNFVNQLENNVPVLAVYNWNADILQSYVAKAILEYPLKYPSKVLSHGFMLWTSWTIQELSDYLKLSSNWLNQILKEKFKI